MKNETVLRGTATVSRLTGAARIVIEREMQKDRGYTPEHDVRYDNEELRMAAIRLCLGDDADITSPDNWVEQLAQKHAGPSIASKVQRLVIAGALCAAEIDRLNSKLDEEES